MMTRRFQVFRLSTLWLLSGMFSCSYLAGSVGLDLSNIGEVQQNRAIDTIVSLKGNVKDRAQFLGTGAYQLQDNTGAIWVLTKQSVPTLGEELLIKGTVRYQEIKLKELATQDLGEVYIEEIEQLERTPSQKNSPAKTK